MIANAEHRKVLVDILKPVKPGVGAEIGVQRGYNAANLLRQFKAMRLYAVDCWAWPTKNHDTVDNRETTKRLLAQYGSRCTIMMLDSHRAADHFALASLDFVFIDAEHDVVSVSRDIADWAPKVRPGGILAGHDYRPDRYPGLCNAVDIHYPGRHLEDYSVWWVEI